MAGSMSDYLENKILDHSLGKTAFTMPASVYVALYSVAPTDAGGGTELTTAGGYARVQLTGAMLNAASGGSITNSADIQWSVASAAYSGTIVAIGLLDSATIGAGNLLWWGTLSTSKTIATNDQFKIAASNLTITLD